MKERKHKKRKMWEIEGKEGRNEGRDRKKMEEGKNEKCRCVKGFMLKERKKKYRYAKRNEGRVRKVERRKFNNGEKYEKNTIK